MTLFSMMPVYRGVLCMGTILLFLLYAVDIMLSFRERNTTGILLSAGLLLCTYVVHQPIKAVIFCSAFGKQAKLAAVCGGISAWVYITPVLILFGLGFAILYRHIAWDQSHISPSSIKESIDNLSSGLAFYQDDGSCLLVNNIMNRICVRLTGHVVWNGCELQRAAESSGMLVDMGGRKYQITHRLLPYGKGTIHELAAGDVTELFEKNEAMRKGNAELAALARKMKHYSLTIDETVRKQEILQAKVHIHDEMNRLLLATSNAASGNVSEEELEKLLNTWKNNALLLCMEADTSHLSNTEHDLETLASVIDLQIQWDGKVTTRDAGALQLFTLSAREALNNAAKHALAKHLYVSVRETDTALCVTYRNDGNLPGGPVLPAGGLRDLQQMLERAGGSMSVSAEPAFALTVTIPLGGNTNAV